MVRGFAVAAVLVLLLSSASIAAVDQTQGFAVGNGNSVFAIGPESAATNTNAMTVAQDQLATDRGSHVTAFQGEAGSLVQSAGASAIAGTIGVLQGGLGYGVQAQLQDGSSGNLGAQIQDMDANLSQAIVGDGLGSALGLQNFVGFQTQMVFTIFGASANTQAVGVSLIDAMGRSAPGAGTFITAATNIGLGQVGTP
jgi:opacity protein-like surface antigen